MSLTTPIDQLKIYEFCLQIFTLFLLSGQILFLYLQIKADHNRRKKTATLEYISTKYAEARYEIEKEYGDADIAKTNADEIIKDHVKMASLKRLMAVMEYASVGINMGIFDKDVVYRTSCTSFINNYNKLKSIIEKRRINEGNKVLIEYEKVISEFQTIKAKENISNNGNIKNF
jgi:hypothetical protein